LENDSFGSFETACQGKIKFDSWREAQDYGKKLKKRRGFHLKAYSCMWCAHFHIGHDRRKMLRRKNRGKIKVEKSVDKRKQV